MAVGALRAYEFFTQPRDVGTGTYTDAYNKIRSELRGDGTTQFALEEDQGLIGSTIDSNVDGYLSY